MIKDIEKTKMEMKEEICEIIEKYVDDMEEGSNKDKFPIDKIEKGQITQALEMLKLEKNRQWVYLI